ncbi:hypothetical protein BOX15_Mlig033343g3 [Macrostomum lignano]|uniref:Uncharacterized protein n=1 Tax=Macrostomum lignano TaxID=282301 RepID=A0A267FX55_9PLAT|nr:hypothetical protein BOX15_Mlig033343g3 [Macrostomum lignano]
MESYLQSIRSSAMSFLDGSRAWDGGIFQLVGERHLLYSAVVNRSLDRQAIVGDAKSTMLSGGNLTAIVFTVLLVLALITLIVVSICCRRRTDSNASNAMKNKLRLRASRVNQLPISLRRLMGIVSALVLLMALVPLMLSFAANSRLHASVSDSQSNRDGTVANQIQQAFDSVETFLADLVPKARRDVQPVIQWTLDMTAAMKNKSQTAYQNAFREKNRPNTLTASSSDLLDRMGLYYYTGVRLGDLSKVVNSALNNLNNARLLSFEADCRRYQVSDSICRNHSKSINDALIIIRQVHNEWAEKPSSMTPQGAFNNVTNLLRDFVGTLDGTNNSPEAQQRIKEKKVNVSIEFNRNISSVFDRELNSTEFILSGLNTKLDDLENKTQKAIGSLRNASTRVQAGYAKSSSRFESMRFGVTTVLLVAALC